MGELLPCPYDSATTCDLKDGCKGCEVFGKYHAGETTPRNLNTRTDKLKDAMIEGALEILTDKEKQREETDVASGFWEGVYRDRAGWLEWLKAEALKRLDVQCE